MLRRLAVLVILCGLLGCSGAGSTPPPPGTSPNQVIVNYTLPSFTVPAGTKVTWTNEDSVAHTVTSDATPPLFDSGPLAPGATYSFTFTTPGTYPYHCNYHSSMHGTVVVS